MPQERIFRKAYSSKYQQNDKESGYIQNINLEEADVRRTSYGLVSPNREINAAYKDSGTEQLDAEQSEEQSHNNPLSNGKFFEIINEEGFSNETYNEIFYNQKQHADPSNSKLKFRCINTASELHSGYIKGIGVLETGLVVTSGDKTVKFWNPMDNDLIAVINETEKVGKILTFPKVKQFYYVLGNKVKSFDYSIGTAAVIYEGMSDITCMERFDNGENNSKQNFL